MNRRKIARVSDAARQVRRAIDNGDGETAWSYAVLTAKLARAREPRRYWCGMCDRFFSRSGDCPACGFDLERWPKE